jgi:hypothetical protein
LFGFFHFQDLLLLGNSDVLKVCPGFEMSSWLDTKFLGSIAKNALAEAQKTLDKALDIKDDDEGDKFEDQSQAIVTPIRSNQDQAGSTRQAPNTLVKSFSSNLGVGGWGSFTGSFFEAAELGKEKETEQQKSEKLEKIIKQNSSDGGSSKSIRNQ